MERVFFLKKDQSKPMYISLYEEIVASINSNELHKDEAMPSIRHLAKAMNISKTTIENAYSQLVAEGYIYSKPQKGYYVSDIPKVTAKEVIYQSKDHSTVSVKSKYDFKSEYVEEGNFDVTMWKRNINKVLAVYERELYSSSDLFGEMNLKVQVAEYFGRVRGIKAGPDQIIIGAGIQTLLYGFASFMKERGFRSFGIENPGFDIAREIFEQQGYSVNGLALKDRTLDVSDMGRYGKMITFVSPSYQFPYGEIMPVSDRLRLLNLAVSNSSYIIEDDYNNELRYIGKPITSLQGMDRHERVVYIGSFSTLLVPSIRISFMVLPRHLVNEFKNQSVTKVQSASKLEQLGLAQMLQSGDFSKHIRRLRKAYREKNLQIDMLLREHITGDWEYSLPKAGVSAVLDYKKKTKASLQIDEIIIKLEEKGILVAPMKEYLCKNSNIVLEKSLVLNYRGIKDKHMKDGIAGLGEILCQGY